MARACQTGIGERSRSRAHRSPPATGRVGPDAAPR
jgi:hypothetical protein